MSPAGQLRIQVMYNAMQLLSIQLWHHRIVFPIFLSPVPSYDELEYSIYGIDIIFALVYFLVKNRREAAYVGSNRKKARQEL